MHHPGAAEAGHRRFEAMLVWSVEGAMAVVQALLVKLKALASSHQYYGEELIAPAAAEAVGASHRLAC
jgi:hypothetical protein